ncbi:MAG: hypothetical protein G01um101429_710 [Parcubacteria group bacterium Gr01-1014_29]|nr:MAG: hypothetical protein G01um101429_710 [Parcubacteria group bacterium Gr01-1014_29]
MIFSSDYLTQTRRIHHRTRIGIAGVICGVLIVAAYFIYQTRAWILLPELVVERPLDGAVTPGPVVIVEGIVSSNARLTVNGVEAYSGRTGRFHRELLLAAGLHSIEITAENKFGRKRIIERRIVVEEER